MVKSQKTTKNWILSSVIFVGMIVTVVFPGIPEPGIILHGLVRVNNCTLTTNNELIWTFTPVAGGDAVTVRTKLTEVEGQNGLFSYKVLIPLEKDVPGFPVSDNAIPISAAPVEYARTAEIVGTALKRTDSVDISAADRGTTQVVSLVF